MPIAQVDLPYKNSERSMPIAVVLTGSAAWSDPSVPFGGLQSAGSGEAICHLSKVPRKADSSPRSSSRVLVIARAQSFAQRDISLQHEEEKGR